MYTKDINDVNQSVSKNYMQLAFNFTFTEEQDEVFCCYTVPYSYSDMQSHFNSIKTLTNSSSNKFIRFESIG